MVYSLTVDISGNSEGLVYALLTENDISNTYTSQGYTARDSSNNYFASTDDVVNTTTYSSDIYQGGTGTTSGSYPIVSNFKNLTTGTSSSSFYYYPIENVYNSATLKCDKYDAKFTQKKMTEDPSGVFQFYDSSGNSNGTVDYNQTLNRFTATNYISSKYNYQNISIIANAGMSYYFYENGTGNYPTSSDGYPSSIVNAMYAMNASFFDKL